MGEYHIELALSVIYHIAHDTSSFFVMNQEAPQGRDMYLEQGAIWDDVDATSDFMALTFSMRAYYMFKYSLKRPAA